MQNLARMSLMIATTASLLALNTFTAANDHDGDERGAYAATPLVSDAGSVTTVTDPNLVNGWGLVMNPTGPAWLADNGTGRSTLYLGTGAIVPLVVTIPAAPSSGSVGGTPTGIVFNGGSQFLVAKTVPAATGTGTTTLSGAAKFIYATEDGIIAGWAPSVDAANARIAVDSSAAHAVYKGIAIGGNGMTPLIYVADFHNRQIAVFDGSFKPVVVPGAFLDPELPVNYAPFGIQNINGDIYVSYAKQDVAGHDEIAGAGKGFVDVFDPAGKLINRLVSRGELNAPWGLALAPASFGRFGGALLVGNFGDGEINAYDVRTGRHLGELRDTHHKEIVVGGLWGMAFGNGIDSQPTNTLFYAAGPGDEQHGAYGAITVVADVD